MKKILIIALMPLFALCMGSCKKTEPHPVGATHKGVVLFNVCGNIVIQSQGLDFFGENNWTDENNASKPVYDHVFTVANPCDFGAYSGGEEINYRFVAPKPQGCAQCLLYVVTPETKYHVVVVK